MTTLAVASGSSHGDPLLARLEDALAVVQREWNGWRTAMIRVADLRDVHWRQPPGAPRPLLHATVRCDRLLSGDIAHDCDTKSGPHDVVVCLLKRHSSPGVFEALSRRADADSQSPRIADPRLCVTPLDRPMAGAVLASRAVADAARSARRRLTAARMSLGALAVLTAWGAVQWRRSQPSRD